ncbi:uncharacterized protein [Clytia hemisphaerica]|uniref:Uncharacterized protein n=1 Tax=Clytia hemisphaerica TaxID=252671 RepID=A0A7M5X3W8_9CNID
MLVMWNFVVYHFNRLYRRFPVKKFVIFAVCILLGYKIVTKSYHRYTHNVWVEERKTLIERYEADKSNFVNQDAACAIPRLNPFSKEVIHMMHKTWEKCSLVEYGQIEDGVFVVDGKKNPFILTVYIQYIRRAPKRGEISNDFAVSYSEKIFLKKENGKFSLTLTEDHIRVGMVIDKTRNQLHVEFQSHVTKTPGRLNHLKKLKEMASGLKMNVAIQMFDSQSNANIRRQAVRTIQYLEQDEHSFIFNANSIVGDGTTAQVSAMLTGIAEEDQYETRRGFPNTRTVDDFTWIFEDFSNAGYATVYTEEDTRYGTFNYRLNGFKEPPTLWYPKPTWLSWDAIYLRHSLCSAEKNMAYLKYFDQMFDGVGKFAFALTAYLTHDSLDAMQSIDQSIVELIQYYKNEGNTMFVLFGDHGSRTGGVRDSLQGKLEERLPFLSITMPKWFRKKHPDFYKAMGENTNVLTSYFDVYATYRHILSYPVLPTDVFGQSLFTKLPLNRTCGDVGVKEHWCACLDYKDISVNDPSVKLVAGEVVKYMNSLLVGLNNERKTCAQMSLDKIIHAGVRKPKEVVQKFKNTKRNEKCDSCAIDLDQSMETDQVSIRSFEIVLTVQPSGGKFEVNAKLGLDNVVTVDPQISRINMYGDQPKCIATIYPHLRPFCYCV